jgi:hypothetical protein
MRSTYSIKLELLFDLKIKIEQINLFELKFNLLITLLLIKNLKIRKKSKKLNYIKIKLFFIKVIKKLINYKLDLFKDIKMFLVFYILLLKLFDFNTFI